MRKRTATKVFCLGLCNADQSLRKSSVKAALAMSRRTLKQTLSLGHGISHGGIIKVSLGLLCLGKSDFDAIENYRHDQYFKASLGIDQVPSASRLRQRLDADADTLPPVMYEQSIEFLVEAKVPVSRLSTGPVALDIDVFPLDNSKTRKEGVSRTYKSYAGYAPIAAYLGQEGWYLARELRDGSRHRQNAFLDTLERVIPHVRRLTSAPLLVRRESGHDALETRATVVKPAVDFILKWNPRRQEREGGLAQAEAQGHWESPREGKRVALFSLFETQTYQGQPYGFRKVIRVIERTIDKHGQQLLIPDIELEGGWTTLQATDHADDQVIALYRDHATSEQFHGEL